MRPILPRESDVSPVQIWLLLILSDGPNYGYNVIQRLDQMFSGYWKPKAGTIYPALDKLAERGLISGKVEHREEGPERKYYTITERGEAVLKSGMDRWSRVMDHIEVYGERHRAICKLREKLSCEEVGELFTRLGAAIKEGSFDVSKPIPKLAPFSIEMAEPLDFKFLYAYGDDGYEIEIEIEWDRQKDEKIIQLKNAHESR